jgi:DNA-binding MarR family transcriptional regulator
MAIVSAKRLQSLADQAAGQCVAARVRALNRLISNVYNAKLSPAGITISQFGILTAVIKTQPVQPAKIGAILGLEKSTLSRNLDLLRRNGWVEIDGTRKNQTVRLTPSGAELYSRAFPHWRAAQDEVLGRLGLEAQKLGDLLRVCKPLG